MRINSRSVGTFDSKSSHRKAWILALPLLAGCSMKQLAIDTQAEIMEEATPSIEEQSDYDFVRIAAPGNLLQIDGLLRVAPDNPRLLLLGTKGYGSYAYGFVEEEMTLAEAAGDFEFAEYHRARARNMYLKAKGMGMRLLEAIEPGFEQALGRDPDVLREFVTAHFTDESAVPALFWTGYAWGSAINLSRDNPVMLADLPFPSVLIEQAVKLDEIYYHAAGHVFLGVFHSSLGTSIGGDPAKGKQHFERAFQLTQRRAGIVHVNYAESYAVQTQDRALFVALLEEVMNANAATDPELVLPNVIAKRRAQRLLDQADDLILEPLEDLPRDDVPPGSLEGDPPERPRASPSAEAAPTGAPSVPESSAPNQ